VLGCEESARITSVIGGFKSTKILGGRVSRRHERTIFIFKEKRVKNIRLSSKFKYQERQRKVLYSF
jgi:hypothetical protein